MGMFIKNEKVKFENISQLKWSKVMDINHFKAYLKDLNMLQRQAFIKIFMNQKEKKPLIS